MRQINHTGNSRSSDPRHSIVTLPSTCDHGAAPATASATADLERVSFTRWIVAERKRQRIRQIFFVPVWIILFVAPFCATPHHLPAVLVDLLFALIVTLLIFDRDMSTTTPCPFDLFEALFDWFEPMIGPSQHGAGSRLPARAMPADRHDEMVKKVPGS